MLGNGGNFDWVPTCRKKCIFFWPWVDVFILQKLEKVCSLSFYNGNAGKKFYKVVMLTGWKCITRINCTIHRHTLQ